MKSLILVMFMIFTASSAYALDIPENYNAKVERINFYPNGAKFEFHVEPEDNDKFRAIIPGAFDPDSIRILNPEIVYSDIMSVRYPRTRWVPEQLQALEAQQEEQAKKVNELSARQASLEQTLKLLKESTPDKANPPAIITYIRDAQEMRLDAEKELAALKVSIAQEREKLNMLTKELDAKRPSGDNSYLEITGEAGGTVEFEAFTTAASWRPKYILELETKPENIAIHMFVRASQQTGIDFDGDMSLHTKTPDENIYTPSLAPQKVGIKPKVEPVRAPARMNSMMLKAAPMMEAATEEEDYMMDLGASRVAGKPRIRETLADRAVDIDGAITGDGTEREFEVIMSDLNLSCKPMIMLIPEVRPDAWILASMDEGNEHLIPGEASVRVDNVSTGNIYLEEYGIGQKVIPFGYAQQITAKKTSLVDKTGSSWFSGGVFTSGYKIEVTNGTKEDKVITIRDRLPIPTDDKITLNVKRIEPKEKERDAENRLTWEIEVPAGGTIPIIVDYDMRYPSGEELQYK